MSFAREGARDEDDVGTEALSDLISPIDARECEYAHDVVFVIKLKCCLCL